MNGYIALWIEELVSAESFSLYTESEKAQILTLCAETADKCAGWARTAQKTQEGVLAYRQQHANWLFADTVGMVCPFLCRYGTVKKDEELLNLGILQMQTFLKHGMDRRSGLPYHGYDENSGIKYGIIGWGRACGWVMKGMAEGLAWIPSRNREKRQLKQAFWNLKDSAAKYQRQDGGFSWQIQAVDGPVDVSAGAMVGNAIWMVSLKSEIKAETLKMQEHLADSFLISITGKEVRNCSGECHGFAEYPQVYGSYPWGTGSVLRFLALKEKVAAEQKNRPAEPQKAEVKPEKPVKKAEKKAEKAEVKTEKKAEKAEVKPEKKAEKAEVKPEKKAEKAEVKTEKKAEKNTNQPKRRKDNGNNDHHRSDGRSGKPDAAVCPVSKNEASGEECQA